MNEMNGKTPESHECKRQLCEQRRAILASETAREQRKRRLQLRHEARKRREQSCWAEQTSQEAEKRLVAQRQRDASVKQLKKRFAGCWIKAKVLMLAAMKTTTV